MSWSTGSKKKGTWQGFGEGRLFPLSALGQARSEEKIVYLIEGEPDCLCGESRGLCCITSTFGADNWKDEWNALFKGLHVRIAYDNDAAGRKGMARVCEHLPAFAEKVECITWPEWMGEKEDLTDWFVKYEKTKKDFEELPWVEAYHSPESSHRSESEIEAIRIKGGDLPQIVNRLLEKMRLAGAVFDRGGEARYVLPRGVSILSVQTGSNFT